MNKIKIGDVVKTQWNNFSTIHGVVEHIYDNYAVIKVPTYYDAPSTLVFTKELKELTKVEHTLNIIEG